MQSNLPFTAALQAGDRGGDEGFGWHLWTRDDECFPVTSTSPLVSTRSVRAAWCKPAEHPQRFVVVISAA